MYGMFFFLVCFRVVLLCSVFVQRTYKTLKKPKNLKTFFKKLRFFSSPAVAYIANNSRTQRFSVSKFGRKVPHLRCDSHTSLKFKRSKVRVTRPISADTHRAPYLPNGKAYELQTWYTDGGRRSASATGAMTSKIKGQGRKVTWSVWAVLAQWPISRNWIVVVSSKFALGTLKKYQDEYDRQSRWHRRSKVTSSVRLVSASC